MKHVSEIVSEVIADRTDPIMTGLPPLDELVGGYYPGELTVVCGGENVGKTAFIVHQVNRMAIDLGIATYLNIGFMNEQMWLSMMAAYYCGIHTNNLHTVLSSPMYEAAVNDYLTMLKQAPLFVEAGFIQEPELEHTVKVIKREGIKIAFIDDAMWFGDDRRDLKRLAIECGIPVVAAMLTRPNERDGLAGYRPMLSDLDSQRYGSDVVIGLMDFEANHIYQDENGRNLRDVLELGILKNKGMMALSQVRIRKSSLYARCLSKDDEKQIMEEMIVQNHHVSTLLEKLKMQSHDGDFVC